MDNEYTEADWVELSLAGDLEAANRVQYRRAVAARTNDTNTQIREDLTDYLPTKRIPAPPCPGFERLDAIMMADYEEKPKPEKTLVNYTSSRAEILDQLNEAIFND